MWIGARDADRGRVAAASIGARSVQLDVTDDESVRSAVRTIGDACGRIDVLVNNAGILSPQTMDVESALSVLDTNVVGIVRVTEAALALLEASEDPVVVNVSSGMGSFWAVTNPDRAESEVMLPLYSASKSAATMLTVQYAKLHPHITFNAVEPGYTATDMNAERGGGQPVEEGVVTIVRLATLGSNGPSGTLQERAGILPW